MLLDSYILVSQGTDWDDLELGLIIDSFLAESCSFVAAMDLYMSRDGWIKGLRYLAVSVWIMIPCF